MTMTTAATRDTAHGLPLALCDLLYPDAPPPWHAAARQAARLLAPWWEARSQGRSPATVLETLSLLIYATAATRRDAIAAVSVTQLLAVLDGERDVNDEPIATKDTILEGLAAAGRTRFGDGIGQLHARLTRRLAPVDHVPVALGGATPGPSPLRHGLARASIALHVLNGAGNDLADVPLPPPTALRVDGCVRVVDGFGHGAYRAATVTCTTCGATHSGTIATEAGTVTYTCPADHTTLDFLLTPSRVRAAIHRQVKEDEAARLAGDLFVPAPTMPADTDLRPDAFGVVVH